MDWFLERVVASRVAPIAREIFALEPVFYTIVSKGSINQYMFIYLSLNQSTKLVDLKVLPLSLSCCLYLVVALDLCMFGGSHCT